MLKCVFRAADLGIDVWDAENLAHHEAVAVTRLSGHFILAPVTVLERELWITVAFDHVGYVLFFLIFN